MNDRFAEIDAELGRMLSMAPAERAGALEQLRKVDLVVATEVASLLQASLMAGDFLESPAIEHFAPMLDEELDLHRSPADAPGQLIGRYRLVSPLGRGGMGEVWLAERADGAFEQRVALKLVKRGMDSDEVVTRFRRERQILARLEHPNIARLLDGGLHADGRPYLVMEYVDGQSCTLLCRDRTVSVERQLDVFSAVCRAVHFAHQNLVVHGDIKPSNIIVATDGTVKLLDFGVARLLAGDSATETRTGWGRAITPEYASPEQLRGEPLTTASDVYQLGALLFELLSGRRLHASTRARAEQELTTDGADTVELPSAAIRKQFADHAGERRWRRVSGDLDAIVLQALENEPARRYTSVATMAEDISRHRSGGVVLARGANRRYHLVRFLRKHRAQFATYAALLLMASVLVAANTQRLRRERDRALLQATKAGQSAEILAQFFDGWNLDAADRTRVSAVELLRRVTLSTEREYAQDDEVRASLLSLLVRLNTSTGLLREAATLLDTAVAIQRRLRSSDQSELGATLRRRGHLFWLLGKFADAERDLREALELERASLGASHLETLRTQQELGQVLAVREREIEAIGEFNEILSRLESENRAAVQFRSRVRGDLGYNYFRLGRYQEALAVLDPLLEEQRAMFGDVHMATLGTMRSLASTVRDMGNLDRADTLYREALRSSQALYGPDHQQTLTAALVLALQMHRRWQLEEAGKLTEQSLARIHSLSPDARNAVRLTEMNLTGLSGVVMLDQKKYAAASRRLHDALAIMRTMFPGGNDEETDFINRLAYIAQVTHQTDAGALYADAIRVRQRRAPGAIDYATDGLHFLAWVMNERGNPEGARILYQRVDSLYKNRLTATHPYRMFVEQQLSGLAVSHKSVAVPDSRAIR